MEGGAPADAGREGLEEPSGRLRLPLAKQPGEGLPQTPSRPRPSRASNQHRALGRTENASRDIAHDVVLQWATRTRGTRNDQVVIPFTHLIQELINDEAVPDSYIDDDTEFFENFLFRDQIATKFRTGSE